MIIITFLLWDPFVISFLTIIIIVVNRDLLDLAGWRLLFYDHLALFMVRRSGTAARVVRMAQLLEDVSDATTPLFRGGIARFLLVLDDHGTSHGIDTAAALVAVERRLGHCCILFG